MAAVARVGVPFDLKSTSLDGLALVLRTADLDLLADAMKGQFGDTPDVFGHDPVVVDLSGLDAPGSAVDFVTLVGLLARHRLRAAGVRGGSDALMRAALDAGLGDVAESAPLAPAPRREPPPSATEKAPVPLDAEPASGTAASPVSPTLIVDKPLRSGQQIYAKGGDLVVLATVNVGAEVIADGSIHVYGALRGKAVAGAKGNVDARIFSTCMEPQLLAIAGTYRTTENPLPVDVLGKTAQIRLDGERLVFEPLA